jgi:hypothetical protein
MIILILTLTAVAVLSMAGASGFLMIVISIHRADRAERLAADPRSHTDATTRRLLGVSGRMSARRDEERN